MLAIRLCYQHHSQISSLKTHDDDFAFQHIDLQQACIKYFSDTGLMRENNGNDRPRKRTRLSLPDKAQQDADIRSDLMSALNSLLGSKELTNLTDLSETVT